MTQPTQFRNGQFNWGSHTANMDVKPHYSQILQGNYQNPSQFGSGQNNPMAFHGANGSSLSPYSTTYSNRYLPIYSVQNSPGQLFLNNPTHVEAYHQTLPTHGSTLHSHQYGKSARNSTNMGDYSHQGYIQNSESRFNSSAIKSLFGPQKAPESVDISESKSFDSMAAEAFIYIIYLMIFSGLHKEIDCEEKEVENDVEICPPALKNVIANILKQDRLYRSIVYPKTDTRLQYKIKSINQILNSLARGKYRDSEDVDEILNGARSVMSKNRYFGKEVNLEFFFTWLKMRIVSESSESQESSDD
ncbi:MAG: hypothetical protein MHMPM18_003495 [Marteilia pararefringens]